ncbi:MAG: hypothetical protein LBB15_00225 [Puniceicoccales bacterium]|nr:hypothetical protein [Puniceicoccales bacterium]
MAKDDLEFNFSFDDLGDQFSYAWSERNGRKYLADIEDSVHKFYNLYIKSRHMVNHLDFIFAGMNWMKNPNGARKSGSYESGIDAATFHCSPLNVAFSAVFAFLENIFDVATRRNSFLPQRSYFDMYRSINAMLRESMCGIFSIDSMDYVLTVCHFKKMMLEINTTLAMCNDLISSTKEEILVNLLTDIRIAMFDMRELSWRAISLCDSAGE